MRTLNRLLVYVFAFSMLASTSCRKDKRGIWKGIVVSKQSGKPVAGVTINISEQYDSGSHQTQHVGTGVSDANVKYKIDATSFCGNLIVEHYSIHYSATKYTPAGETGFIPEDEKCVVDNEFDIVIP